MCFVTGNCEASNADTAGTQSPFQLAASTLAVRHASAAVRTAYHRQTPPPVLLPGQQGHPTFMCQNPYHTPQQLVLEARASGSTHLVTDDFICQAKQKGLLASTPNCIALAGPSLMCPWSVNGSQRLVSSTQLGTPWLSAARTPTKWRARHSVETIKAILSGESRLMLGLAPQSLRMGPAMTLFNPYVHACACQAPRGTP